MSLKSPEGEYGGQSPLPPTPLQYLDDGVRCRLDIQKMQRLEGEVRDPGVLLARRVAIVGREYLAAYLKRNFKGAQPKSHDDKSDTEGALAAVLFGASYEAIYHFLHNVPSETDGSRRFSNDKFFALFDSTLPEIGMKSDRVIKDIPEANQQCKFSAAKLEKLKEIAEKNGISALMASSNAKLLPPSIYKFINEFSVDIAVHSLALRFKTTIDSMLIAERLIQSVKAEVPQDDWGMNAAPTPSQEKTARRLLQDF
ncbi:MAG TPA: hypothetical protein VF941_06240 [Clostridia bacterium]